jgi:ribosomal protein S18 acetylase RimI-like enzyme
MPVEIRQFRDADKPALVERIKELQAYIASLDELDRTRRSGDFDAEWYVQRLLDKVSKHDGVIYVADDGGAIVGCIAGTIPENTEDDDLEIYPSKDGNILELHVQHGYRGQRLGLRLMQEIERYFREYGCAGCHVDCFAPNAEAHGFYHKVGYTDRLTTLLKIFERQDISTTDV